MSHDVLRDRLVDLAIGALEPRQAAEVEAHAEGCAECRAALAGLRATRELMAGLPPLPAPAHGEGLLLAAAREAAGRRRPARLPGWLWGVGLGAVGAAAAALVTLQLTGAPLRSTLDQDGDALLGRGPVTAAPPASPPVKSAAPAETSPLPISAPARARADRAEEVAAAPAPPPAKVAVGSRATAARPEPKAAPGAPPDPFGPANGGASVATRLREEAPAPAAAPPQAPRRTASAGALSEAPSRNAAPGEVREVARAKARSEALAAPAAAELQDAAKAVASLQAGPAACEVVYARVELRRDGAGRVVGRERQGTVRGEPVLVDETFGPGGLLAGAAVVLGGRRVEVGSADVAAGRLEPVAGVHLARSAAEAQAGDPAGGACRP